MKRIISLFFVFVFVFYGCAKRKQADPIRVKTPSWVRGYENENEFSSVGITTLWGSLKNRVAQAEKNGIENLLANILVGVEDFLLQETICLKDEKRQNIVSDILRNIKNDINIKNLEKIVKRDAVWDSPNGNALYVLIVADKRFISKNILTALDKVQNESKTIDTDIHKLISEIKYDIARDNFKARKRNCVQQDKLLKNNDDKNVLNSSKNYNSSPDVKITNVVFAKEVVNDKQKQEELIIDSKKQIDDVISEIEKIERITDEKVK